MGCSSHSSGSRVREVVVCWVKERNSKNRPTCTPKPFWKWNSFAIYLFCIFVSPKGIRNKKKKKRMENIVFKRFDVFELRRRRREKTSANRLLDSCTRVRQSLFFLLCRPRQPTRDRRIASLGECSDPGAWNELD